MAAQARTKALRHLMFGRLLSFAGRVLAGIFIPIFIYELFGNSGIGVLVFFLFLHLLYGISVPAACKLFNRIGFRHGLVIGMLFSAAFVASLFVLDRFSGENLMLIFVPLAFLCALLFRVFHWVPFHVDFAKYTDHKRRGTQTGLLYGTMTVFAAVSPALGGFIIDAAGYHVLFGAAVLIILAAALPYSRTPRGDETYTWGYWESYKHLIDPANRRLALTSATAGIENMLGVVIWPLFVFTVLSGDYLSVGLLSTFIIVSTALLQYVLGTFLDRFPKGQLLRISSIFSAIGWFIKIFLTTAAQIFVVGVYHNIVKSSLQTSYNAFFYEIAGDSEHYVDEYTAIREMAIQFGKAAALAVGVVILIFLPLQWAFLVGLVSSLALNAVLSQRFGNHADEEVEPQRAM